MGPHHVNHVDTQSSTTTCTINDGTVCVNFHTTKVILLGPLVAEGVKSIIGCAPSARF